jgi:succinyl-CoA synthetase beta subunit
VILISKEGGVEIETLAQEDATKIQREPFDLTRGLQNFQISELAYRFNLNKALTKELSSIIKHLYSIFIQFDAELVEINPLFITKEGNMIAGDGKIVIDENSMQRQPRFTRTREFYDSDMEYEAALQGIPYLQFDGDISLMCAGAGLTTTVFDLINYEGGSVANYLEFGGPNYRKAYEAMELCLRNTSKVILVVTFGTIARADVMAQGIVDAASRLHPDRPIVTCIRGTGEIEAVEILEKRSNLVGG